MDSYSILVDVDSLLDFRLSALSRLNDAFTAELLREPTPYLDRNRDDEWFLPGGVTPKQFREVYDNRDATYLKGALRTGVYWLLGKIISERLVMRDVPLGEKAVELVINTYPFYFSDEGLRVLVAAVGITLDVKIPITTIYKETAMMTPQYLKSQFSDIVMYDFDAWHQLHAASLDKIYMPEVVVYTPAIMRHTKLDPEKLKELSRELNGAVNPFEWTMMGAAPRIDLRYVDTRFFSIELKSHPVTAA